MNNWINLQKSAQDIDMADSSNKPHIDNTNLHNSEEPVSLLTGYLVRLKEGLFIFTESNKFIEVTPSQQFGFVSAYLNQDVFYYLTKEGKANVTKHASGVISFPTKEEVYRNKNYKSTPTIQEDLLLPIYLELTTLQRMLNLNIYTDKVSKIKAMIANIQNNYTLIKN